MGEDTKPTYTPEPVKVIRDLETLRVLTDPLRMRILAALQQEPRTVKEVARMLEVPPTRLYYHVNLMEKHGILQVVDTRVVSGIIEKRYGVTAQRFDVDRSLFAPTSADAEEGWALIISQLLDVLREEISRLVAEGTAARAVQNPEDPDAPVMRLSRSVSRLTPEQARAVHRQVVALVEEFDALNQGAPDLEEYVLFVALYPMPADAASPRQRKESTDVDINP
ncbi:MAG: helix-turn-helix domain-containing protein [Chloroflexi bacterium]|nr:helix-turn-helix domain-containing protein [Chloroflexota bacterium]